MSHKTHPIALIAFLTVTSIFTVATPAHAESNSVCLAGDDNEPQCIYTNLEQCRAAASGGLGYCVTSPTFVAGTYPNHSGAGRRHH
jgi:Protein of unknown function (DUF3551)